MQQNMDPRTIAKGDTGACGGRNIPNITPQQKERDKRRRKQGKDASQGTPQRGLQSVATVGASPARPNKPHKKNPFTTKMEPPFEEYWSKEDVQRGLKSSDLVQGVLRINQRNYEDAFVDDPEGGGDYYVNGMWRRNRALERDVVVIQVLPPDQWQDEEHLQAVADSSSNPTLQDLVPSLGALQLGSAESPSASDANTLQSASSVPPAALLSPENTARPTTLVDRLYNVPAELRVGEPEGERKEGELEAQQRTRRDLMMYRRTAKVVYIVEKEHSRACAGHLKAFDKVKALALLSPKDNKVPRVVIPLSNCPEDYSQNSKKYENTLFICRILSWKRDSPFAEGELLRSMGEAGEIEPETESFLIENDIDFEEFSPEALDCLPKQAPWTIPQEEEDRRRDFRKECVFTIDPETARDLDDALHVKEVEEVAKKKYELLKHPKVDVNPKGSVYEVGVHIADVSYFVKADTALDQVASQRATSVYLVQRVIPMLPRLLCEQLCSLNPNEDRLAFSVVWRMSIKGEFQDEWMGRSIIRSCAKLSYSHAQAMIDEPLREWRKDDLPMITNGFTAVDVSWGVTTLNKLAKVLRCQRQSKGTLHLNQPKLKFSLSKDTGLPNGCDVYIQRESNRLIEEFMLLANMAVAHKIRQAFPDRAMLRRHPMPKEKSAQFLVQRCESLGIALDVSSAASVQRCLDHYCGTGEDEESNAMQKMVLVSLCSKIMELAHYFCTGTVEREKDFTHYALNVPRYTHFTSPIRRYADIIVHRQLASALGEGPSFTMVDEEVESQAHHCNKKKKSAKTVEELSMQMFFAIFIRECSPVQERGIVIQVLDKAFDVLVQRYGVIKRIYCEQLPLERFQAGQRGKLKVPYLALEWAGPNGSTVKQELTIMSMVNVELTGSPRPLQYNEFPPHPSRSAWLEKFLLSPENIPIHDIRAAQKLWPADPCPEKLYHAEFSPPNTDITVERDPMLGKLLGFHEVEVSTVGLTAKNSTSLQRAPGPPSTSVKGEATNYPFWPGGLDEPEVVKNVTQQLSELNLNLESDLLTVPPGFERGMTFEPSVRGAPTSDLFPAPETVSISEVLFGGGEMAMEWGEGGEEEEEEEGGGGDITSKSALQQQDETETETLELKQDIDEVIGGTEEISVPQLKTQDDKELSWAVKVDSNASVTDFYEKVPKMAHTWPFEPDPFQKQAILFLEKHESVFVAAHTSAGKTVVAEYAIALSLRHLTRTIYTSPIKALSNQKFRDFRQTFGDKNVGLLTGDVQIKTEAPCLIMTTEILRSMLYNGSEVIRDVEWVIFDEVHYINDSERGVVWEEVLIMLPDHIGIIMLSATVPNAMDFASWVGRTKRKKMYVISTFKRPVPLRHFLYTGNSKQTSDQMFEIVGDNKRFNTAGYRAALQAKKERTTKAATNFGPKFKHHTNPKEEKNVWLSLVHMLQKKDKLPMVAFTFSRARCDSNADSLSSLDLTTSTEKSEIHVFFKRSTTLLKGSDQRLPQVVWMRDVLKRGIGVHHSGILPIMKEVIEMLFQRGLVKLLFATETFAMGVNMPARTVVFDAIRKHDGVHTRDLYPGEYIQMAGRAGRRGKDTMGTVILLCKADIPEASDLQKMILGQPTTLQSQFRLTYSMLLNLMRVETLRVEDMMKRSYAENDTTRHEVDRKHALQQLEVDFRALEQLDCPMCDVDLDHYYTSCARIQQLQKQMQAFLLTHPNALKVLSPGRVVTVYTNAYHYSLAVILQQHSSKSTARTFTVLMLCNSGDDSEKKAKSLIDSSLIEYQTVTPYKALSGLFTPDGEVKHAVVTLDGQLVFNITEEVVNIEPKNIIDDYNKRQIPRFRDSPPGQACTMATQALLRLTEAFPNGVPWLNAVKHLRITDMEFVQMRDETEKLESTMDFYTCKRCPEFEAHFQVARKRAELRERCSNLKFMLSEESLQLLPEYNQRIGVMRSLMFLSGHNVIELKGSVACELHSHEVLLTELLFTNMFSQFDPPEIAALLSCVVFQQSRCSEPKLTERLQKGQKMIQDAATRIALCEREHGIDTSVEDYLKEFKFGLVEVVYEWANGMEFVEITKLTDVSEGIIVRCIQRLDETCRDVRKAARVIGDTVLYQKMHTCSTLIKRDIVFAASLYTI